jgi:hypothetical protein
VTGSLLSVTFSLVVYPSTSVMVTVPSVTVTVAVESS